MVMDLTFGISIMERDPDSKNHLSVSDCHHSDPIPHRNLNEFCEGFGGEGRKCSLFLGVIGKGAQEGQAGFGAQLGPSRCWNHSGCGSNQAFEKPWLFGTQFSWW